MASGLRLCLFVSLLLCCCVAKQERVRLFKMATDYQSVYGDVEIFYENKWRLLCGREWSLADATVTCRTLGFGRGARTAKRRPIPFNEPKYRKYYFLFEGLECRGTESNLTSCPNFDSPKVQKQNLCAAGIAVAVCLR